MAYISKVKNREGTHYLYLKESYRVGNKTKTRILKSFGKLETLEKNEPDIYQRLCKEAKAGLLAEDSKKKILIQFDMDTPLGQNELQNYGWKIIDEAYKFLGISAVVKEHQENSKFEFSLDETLKNLVIQRCILPGSKKKNIELQNSLVGEWNLKLHDTYRALEHINRLKVDIQKAMHKSISNSIGRVALLVFYDVTNYYFDTDFNDEDILDENDKIIYKSLRKRGPSKEKKPKPIVQLGLFMDSNGIPISYKLFSGNHTDPITYIPAIEQVKKQYGIKRVVTVADKAMNSAKNVTTTLANGDGWLFSQKVRGTRGVAKDIQEFVLDKNGWKYNEELTFALKSKIRKRKLSNGKTIDEKIVVTWSEKYANREKKRRKGALEYASKLTNAELYRMTSKKGGKKYLDVKYYDKDTGDELPYNPFISIDEEQVKEDAQYDGLNVILTSELDMDEEQIISSYHQLHKIEDCFRVTKTSLHSRPIYVRNDNHIQGHFLTCFVSLTIIRFIKKVLDEKYSEERIIEAIKSAQVSPLGKGISQVYANEDLKKINKQLGITFDLKYVEDEKIRKYAYRVFPTFFSNKKM